MSRLRRLVVVVALGAGLVAGGAAPAQAAGSRAAIVISGSGYVASFDGTISGLQALQQVASVSTLGFSGQGTAVCAINGVGNPATPSDCLVGPNGEFWQYWRKAPGASGWTFSSSGASGTSVSDGSMEGWVYAAAKSAPPNDSYCSVVDCSPPTTQGVPASSPSLGGSGAASGSTSGTSADQAAAVEATTTSSTTVGANSSNKGGQALVIRPGNHDGSGSPVGVIVAGGAALGIGVGGFWIRRRRHRLVP